MVSLSPKLSDLAEFALLGENDGDGEVNNIKGAEHYICLNHDLTRVKAKKRIIRSILDRETDLRAEGFSAKYIEDELAALSLTLTDLTKNFARFVGIADEIAAALSVRDEGHASSSSSCSDPEILSDVLSSASSSEGNSSIGSSSSFHDCAEIIPHPSLIKPKAMRVTVPKRVEKKRKKGKSKDKKMSQL
ncbi:expressed unknown protein [Seminavis robusta]|uniref:Uncharacterized protein n=1 Tax=Seminavis robusta TaxID=568900 RepID=A0A9N8ECE9_9STRA|nr:expressed unknown protein [Seminavis robusta]|eukprot:Sro742_g195830.1 n/a (190) ;mRNA; r:8430-8999